eukprot:g26570.t1
MWVLFKELLIRVQDQHIPVRRKDKDGKEKDMESSEICVEHANMLGHFEIKKEVVLGLFKSIKSPGSVGINPRLLREARRATGEVPEDWTVVNVVPLFKEGNRNNPGNYKL